MSHHVDSQHPAANSVPAPQRSTPRPILPTREKFEKVIAAAVKTLALASTTITQANAAARIVGEVADPVLREQLGTDLSARLFDVDGHAATQGAELIAVQSAVLGADTCLVLPMPQAGRVARFVNWFENNDYGVNPVLASSPAQGRIDEHGMLTRTRPGVLA